MKAEKNVEAKLKKRTRTRILKLVLALLVILILSVVFLVPMFVSSEKGRQIVLAKINSSLDGQADFADLSMGWLKGIRVTDVNFNNSTGTTSVKVKQIATKPHYGSILMGSLSFGKTIIDEPIVRINLKSHQQKKNPPLELKTHNSKLKTAAVLPLRRIDLAVNNGSLKVTDRQSKTVEVTAINSRLNLRPPGRQTNFDIDMTVVEENKQSKIHADGQITPKRRTGWTLKETSGKLTVEVNDLNIGVLCPLFALAGVEAQPKGVVSANIKSEIKNGQIESLDGILKGKNLNIAVSQLKGDRLKSDYLEAVVELHRKNDLISIEKLQVDSDWLSARASGTVPTTFKSLAQFAKADSNYNLKGSFDCDLPTVLSQMPHAFKLKEGTKVTSGRLGGNINAFTEAGQRKIIGQASIVGLAGAVATKTIALSEPVMIETRITSDKTGVNIDKLDLSASFATVNCSGRVEQLKYNGKADLAKLQSELGQFIDIGQCRIAGELSSKGTVSVKQDLINAVGSALAENLKISCPGRTPFEQNEASAVFDVEVNPAEKTIAVRKLQVVSPQIKIKGDFEKITEGGTTRLKGRADCEYDWSAVSAVAGAFLPKGLEFAGSRKDLISFSSEYPAGQRDKLLANLSTKGRLGFDSAKYLGLHFGPAEVNIRVQNGILKIEPFSTTVNNGQFNFACEVDFNRKPTLLKTPGPIQIAEDIQINDDMSSQLLAYLNPVFANAFNVSGVGNFNCERLAIPLAEAAKNDLEVVGTIQLDRLHLQSSNLLNQILSLAGAAGIDQYITIHPTKFVLRNGFLRYDDMQMDVGNNPVNFSGVIGLDKSLDMKVILPYTTAGRTARIGRETVGERITLPLKGTLDKPELDIGKLLEEQLQQQLREKVLEGIEKLLK